MENFEDSEFSLKNSPNKELKKLTSLSCLVEDQNPFFYPLNSVDKLGQFEILAHKHSSLYKKIIDKESGYKMVVSGPYGNHKYLGMGRFYR